METKKSSQVNLEPQRRMFREIGFILALLLLYGAFEYTTQIQQNPIFALHGNTINDEDLVINTRDLEPPKPEIEPPKPEKIPDSEVVETNNIEDDNSHLMNVTDEVFPELPFTPEHEITEVIPFLRVEKMPEFPGGELALRRFILEKIMLPAFAFESAHTTSITVQYVVDVDGIAKAPHILESSDERYNQAVLDVIHLLPLYTPGEQAGQKVPVFMRAVVVIEIK